MKNLDWPCQGNHHSLQVLCHLGNISIPSAKLVQSIPSEENLQYFKTCGKIPKDTDTLEDFRKL